MEHAPLLPIAYICYIPIMLIGISAIFFILDVCFNIDPFKKSKKK